MAHLYASFADAGMAEKAAGALLDSGVRQEDLSVVANDQYSQTRQSYAAQTTDPNFVAGSTGAFGNEGVGAGYATTGYGTTGTAAGDLNPLDHGGVDSVMSQANIETSAKHGISTTTPEDAGEGAVKGAGIGLGVGLLASLAALTIPGVGLVLGGGVIAAALGATALTAGAGAVAGGATGYLKDQGVPHDVADRYHGTVIGGGAVLSLNIPSGKVDQTTAEAILSKYGAADINAY